MQSPSATLRSAVASPPAVARASSSGSVAVRDEHPRANGRRASGGPSPGSTSTTGVCTSASAGVANPGTVHGAALVTVPVASSPRTAPSHARYSSSLTSTSTTSSSRHPSASFSAPSDDFSHQHPPSSYAEPHISISSTIYSGSSNYHSFDVARYPPSPPGGSSMSPDRESFIDLASPIFPPSGPESPYIRVPSSDRSQPGWPTVATSRSGEWSYGKSSSRSSSPPPSSGSTKLRLAPITPPSQGAEKPPIPTAPKPDFSYRSRTGNKSSPVQSKKPSSLSHYPTADPEPSHSSFAASNALSAKERAERVRTTRKLAQVFGQPPGVSPISQDSPQELSLPNGCLPRVPGPLTLNLNAKRRHHRPVVSMSDEVPQPSAVTPVYDATGRVVWPPPDGVRYVTLAPRRHSAPLSPEDFAFVVPRKSPASGSDGSSMTPTDDDDSPVIHIGPVQRSSLETVTGTEARAEMGASSMVSSRWSRTRAAPRSPASFMDLSDEEGANDGISELLPETPKLGRRRGEPRSPSTASLAESLASDELAEDERRRKREKLAKLHRFLGSRVPPHLVLGPLDEGITPFPSPAPTFTLAPPPALAPPLSSAPRRIGEEDDIHRAKMRRRRSSSAAEFSHTWSDDIDRLKQGLNDREKAINVRRAVKMEKVSTRPSPFAAHAC